MTASSITVLGAGSWGTALAIQAARNGCKTLLWGHDPAHIQLLLQQRCNQRYLPNLDFPSNLSVTANLEKAVNASSILLISVPSHAFGLLLKQLTPFLTESTKIAWATKGFNPHDGLLLSQVATNILPKTIEMAVLSGPTFAYEVAAGLPTALTIASYHAEFSAQLTEMLHNQNFRTYTSNDMIGVQVGGCVKNVLAISAGIADGLGFGANTRAALITRGLQEIIRLGTKMGGKTETFMGLTGLGDLILTCTDNQSRNRRFGIALGQGHNIEQAMSEIGQEIEGILAARETFLLAQKHAIEMPITEQIYNVLHQNIDPRVAVQNLLTREIKSEL